MMEKVTNDVPITVTEWVIKTMTVTGMKEMTMMKGTTKEVTDARHDGGCHKEE